jgi:hypothetical protein
MPPLMILQQLINTHEGKEVAVDFEVNQPNET